MQGSGLGTNWEDVRLLLALGRSRNLGEAGRRLGVDASTVSRRLSNLEQAMDATLFERGRSGIVATETAEKLMPVAEEIEHAVARFTGTVEAFERTIAGTVRIACPPDAAEVLLVPLLPELLRRHPGLRVEIDAGEGLVDLARRGADLALRIVRPEQGNLVVTKLGEVGWTAAADPGLVERTGMLTAWDQVPWIGWGQRFAGIPPARWLANHVPACDPVVRSDSLQVQISAAVQGLGAVLIPSPSVHPYGLRPLQLAPPLQSVAQQWPTDDLHMVTHRALRTVPRIRAVWDFLRQNAVPSTLAPWRRSS